MIYYSHRGNITGQNPQRENSIEYIEEAIKAGYKVEIDVRLMSDEHLWLGHDEAQYKIEDNFLIKNAKNLLIHCKNVSSVFKLQQLEKQEKKLHYFFHVTDNAVLTSKKMIVVYPGKRPIGENAIAMLPEEADYQLSELTKCAAVCSDNIEFYRKLIENENSGSNSEPIPT